MNRKIEWLITIVDRGRGDKVAEVYQRHHVAVQLVTHGRGTATSKIMDVLGLDEPEKDIVLSLVPGALSREILRALEEELHFTRPGAGIAFSILLSGISTAAHSRVTHGRLELCLPQEETSMTSEQHELIVAVTDADGVDIVMDAARAAGARGGHRGQGPRGVQRNGAKAVWPAHSARERACAHSGAGRAFARR